MIRIGDYVRLTGSGVRKLREEFKSRRHTNEWAEKFQTKMGKKAKIFLSHLVYKIEDKTYDPNKFLVTFYGGNRSDAFILEKEDFRKVSMTELSKLRIGLL